MGRERGGKRKGKIPLEAVGKSGERGSLVDEEPQ